MMTYKMVNVMVFVISGVFTLYLFLGGDHFFEGFPWQVYAGVGMISWVGQQVLKFVRDVEKISKEG